eukprot:229243_1
MELTVPFETNFNKAHKRKMDKYNALTNHLSSRDPINKCNLICLEIGSRGIFSKDNSKRLKDIVSVTGPLPNRKQLRRLKRQLEKIIIKASHRIFQQRNNKHWIEHARITEPLYESIYYVP